MQFQYRKIVFLTGAGISAESGLSLFRGKNGLWNNRNPEEVATAEALLQRRSDVLDFYNGLRHDMAEAKPNAAHLAISRLQQGYSGEVYILTQNMDTLHEKAGSENVYHIHGQINKIRCSHCHNIWETWNDITPDMPCPFCRAEKSLRPDIVFFGEEIMFTSVAEDLLRCADLYCHPAEVEIESIACLEAIACGLVPVIADSPKSAAKAFALDEKSLFKNKDAEDMARKIDYWVSHPDERADYSRKYLDSGTQFEQQSCMRQMEQMLFDAAALVGDPA